MSLFYNLIVSPIEIIVDWVFVFFCTKFSAFGIIGAVCGVSLVINFLALPLYNIADSLQEKERKIAKSLEHRVKLIKKAFTGDERFMMLQTYYRQNNYNPVYVLRSSLSILIEIPFFIAAYHYLSNCEALKGSSFWIFKDLGSPDGLFHIGNFKINILPILMTLINFVSGAIYTKDATFREKIQLYGIALVFLVLLYNSPSGLVIYWILNNLFSLAKNIVMKCKSPKKILHGIISGILLCLSVFFLFNSGALYKKVGLLIFSILITFLPFIKNWFIKTFSFAANFSFEDAEKKSNLWVLFFSGLALALLCGLYLPASVIATSPTEFSFLGKTSSPVAYVLNSLSTFCGLFVFWPLCIYFMFGKTVKKIEPALFFVLFIVSLLNVFVFKADYGTVDTNFSLESQKVLECSKLLKILPLILTLFVALLYLFLLKLKKNYVATFAALAISATELILGISKVGAIKKDYAAFAKNTEKARAEITNEETEIKPVYHLSKEQKNVVVIFLDRAVNSFFPYALQQLPELKEQMKGFVYYPNTLSFSSSTIIAAPALMGGYEYTPENLNKRSSELLKKKFNEASLVMPRLFSDAGFDVTVTDPPAPNFTPKGDLSPFFANKNTSAYELMGKYTKQFKKAINFYTKTSADSNVFKEIKNFSILQILFPFLRNTFYGDFKKNYGFNEKYLDLVSCLYFLPELTDFNAKKGNFIFIDNETTHEPVFLQSDFLTPTDSIKVYLYKTQDGQTNRQYQVSVAALKQLGKWFDYLRENSVFDNTRIIVVADHGCNYLPLNDYSDFERNTIPGSFTPILLVKDFYSDSELSTSNEFMTNADTLFLAKKDLPVSNKNPFTGNDFVQQKQDGINVFKCYEPNKEDKEWQVQYMKDKTQFTLDKKQGFHVSKNIFDEKNWVLLAE